MKPSKFIFSSWVQSHTIDLASPYLNKLLVPLISAYLTALTRALINYYTVCFLLGVSSWFTQDACQTDAKQHKINCIFLISRINIYFPSSCNSLTTRCSLLSLRGPKAISSERIFVRHELCGTPSCQSFSLKLLPEVRVKS